MSEPVTSLDQPAHQKISGCWRTSLVPANKAATSMCASKPLRSTDRQCRSTAIVSGRFRCGRTATAGAAASCRKVKRRLGSGSRSSRPPATSTNAHAAHVGCSTTAPVSTDRRDLIGDPQDAIKGSPPYQAFAAGRRCDRPPPSCRPQAGVRSTRNAGRRSDRNRHPASPPHAHPPEAAWRNQTVVGELRDVGIEDRTRRRPEEISTRPPSSRPSIKDFAIVLEPC